MESNKCFAIFPKSLLCRVPAPWYSNDRFFPCAAVSSVCCAVGIISQMLAGLCLCSLTRGDDPLSCVEPAEVQETLTEISVQNYGGKKEKTSKI